MKFLNNIQSFVSGMSCNYLQMQTFVQRSGVSLQNNGNGVVTKSTLIKGHVFRRNGLSVFVRNMDTTCLIVHMLFIRVRIK